MVILPNDLRYGSYVRVSSSKQQRANTIEYQKQMNEHLILNRTGKLIDTFEDKAVSGYNRVASQRPEIQRLVNAVRDGHINSIVFYDESRLSRQIIDFYLDVYAPIVSVNPSVRFFKSSTGDEWDPNSAEAKQNMIYAFQESDRKSRLAKQSQTYRFEEREQRPGGRLPLGIKAVTETQLITNSKLPLVLFIFELASWGYSERHIAELLDDIAPKKGIQEWAHTEINYILNNPLYIGKIAINRRRSKRNGSLLPVGEYPEIAKYPPLVPLHLWKLAHLELKKKSVDKSYRTLSSYLLSGILYCSKCHIELKTRNSTKSNSKGEKPATSKKGKLLRYYYCPQCEQRFNPLIVEQELVTRVRQELSRHINSATIENKIKHLLRNLDTQRREVEEEIQHRRYILNRLENGYYDGHLTDSTITLFKQWTVERLNLLLEQKAERLHAIEELKDLANDENVLSRLVYRAGLVSEVLPHHELRYLLINSLESVSLTMGKSGQAVISEINYRNLPIPVYDDSSEKLLS